MPPQARLRLPGPSVEVAGESSRGGGRALGLRRTAEGSFDGNDVAESASDDDGQVALVEMRSEGS